MSYTEHAPKSYVDSKLALKADVVALQAVSAIATALDTRLSQLARDTYTKTQIDYLTEAIKKGRFKKVDSLPEIGEAELYVIYLVPRSDPESQNVKDEYIVIVGDGDARSWEKVGSTDVDLSGYATLDDLTRSTSAILGSIDNLRDYATSAINNITGVEIPRLEGGISSVASEASSAKSTANSVAAYAAQIESKADQNASDISDLSDEVDGKVPTSRTVNGKALSSDVTLVAGDIPMSGSPSETENVASRIAQIAQSISYLPGFSDLVGLMNDIGYAITQSIYSNTSTYQVGHYCAIVSSASGSINIKLYRCTTAITTPEDFTPAHWQEVWVFPEILSLLAGKADSDGPTITSGMTVQGSIYAERIYTQYGQSQACYGPWTIDVPSGGVAMLPTLAQGDLDTLAVKGNIPYDLGTPTVIDTASSETVEGETVYYGAATLANRTANVVQVTAATALDELRITFPAATSGKVRDFGLRVEVGTGSAALTAPALVPIAPTGETIKLENADGAIPELADGTATAKGVTLLYFSETSPGVFVVKGEQVQEVA